MKDTSRILSVKNAKDPLYSAIRNYQYAMNQLFSHTEPHPRAYLPWPVRWPFLYFGRVIIDGQAKSKVALTSSQAAALAYEFSEFRRKAELRLYNPIVVDPLGDLLDPNEWTDNAGFDPTSDDGSFMQLRVDLDAAELRLFALAFSQSKRRRSGTWRTWHGVKNRLQLRVPHK